MQEIALDIEEGADMVMVKPGMPYLDIVEPLQTVLWCADLRLSGVGRICHACRCHRARLAERDAVILETLTAFKRAGADGILSYFARDAARLLAD